MGRHRERHQLPVRGRWAAGALAALLALVLIVAARGEKNERTGEGVGDAASGVGTPEGVGMPAPVADALSSAEGTSVWCEKPLVETGREVLEKLRSRGDCVLAGAGYLDLTGRTWGCVAQGAGWVEICVVREGADGGGCSVASWRMDAGDVDARALGDAVSGGS